MTAPDRKPSQADAPSFEEEAKALGYDPGWGAQTWLGDPPPDAPESSFLQKLTGALRAGLFAMITLVQLPFFFAARAMGGRLDRQVAGWWCASGLFCAGVRLRVAGQPLHGGGALLVNHASWMDIMVIGAAAPVHFVAKAEVERWPLFGWIGRISNTVFIARKRSATKAQEKMLAGRAKSGHLLCLFPEGTSSDGQRVLPFKSSLFSMFFADGAPAGIAAQPVSIHYAPKPHLDRRFYCFWATIPLFSHILSVLRHGSGGTATITFHEPIDLTRFPDRKSMAAEAERVVREGLEKTADAAWR